MTTRREMLIGSLGLGAATALGSAMAVRAASGGGAGGGEFEVVMTEAEWRKVLTPQQFLVLRREETERAFSSPLNEEKRAGEFHCAGCDNPVYSSEAKFESGTGWPSFWEPIRKDAVGYKDDWYLIFPRTEVHCARCGGHLGHVFDDGPAPTGKRHCINGVAMTFKPAATASG